MSKIAEFNQFLNQNLNESQLKAVKQKEGSLLVIAGAGSGKTRVITSRIANLILNETVTSSSIIALTFTNKAAQEMRHRIISWLGEEDVPFIGTFHSFCLRLLKKYSHLTEIPNFSILDDDDQAKMIQAILQRNPTNKKISTQQISYQISVIKNDLALSEKTNIYSENKLLQEIYLAYEKERKANKSLDFDDLIIETIKLLKNNNEFREQLQQRTQHLLVDEYQDTSKIQHLLLKQIAQKDNKLGIKSLCVVGDEDQSIYSWRGANVENIVNFTKDFPNTNIVKIEQNYRSVNPILEVANKLIENNKNRNTKKLWSQRKANNRVTAITCISEYKEAEMVCQAAKAFTKKKSINTIAVLYRAHYQSRSIEEALIRNSIAYKIIGGIQFYERKEIKDLFAYMKLAVNPFDKVSFFRVINCPTRGLGQVFEEDFYNKWNSQTFFGFDQVAKELIEEKTLTKTKEESLKTFLKIIECLDKNSKPSDVIDYIITQTGYFKYLQENFDQQEAEAKISNVKELIRAAHYFYEQGITTIVGFLDELALMQQKMLEKENDETKIQLMTMHSAKGLEFDTVIIVGIEENILPSSRSLNEEKNLEEERRLFYVGITRAKDYLILSNSQQRNSFGQTSMQICSRFFEEIPANLLNKQNAVTWTTYDFADFFANFFGTRTYIPSSNVITFGKKDNNIWKEHQIVKHKEFDIGIIQKIETKAGDKTILTVKFKNEVKKIDSKFVERV